MITMRMRYIIIANGGPCYCSMEHVGYVKSCTKTSICQMLSRNLFNASGSLGMAKNDDDQEIELKSKPTQSSLTTICLRENDGSSLTARSFVPGRYICRKRSRVFTTAVLTCKGDITDPHFPRKLNCIVQALQNVLSNGKKRKIKVMKVEPWNSVRVTFNIPKEAAMRLRQMAENRDRALQDLGILSVQIEGDQVISLTIAGQYNDPQEILLQTHDDSTASTPGFIADLGRKPSAFNTVSSEPSAGPSNANTDGQKAVSIFNRVSIADINLVSASSTVASVSSGQSSITSSSRGFRSPNVVAPTNETIPFPPTSINAHSAPANLPRPCGTAGTLGQRFPFASMTHAMTTMQSCSQQLSSSASVINPPPYSSVSTASGLSNPSASLPGESKHNFKMPNTIANNMRVSTEDKSESKANVALSSPLLVNLLQNDSDNHSQQSVLHQSNKMLPPPPPPMDNSAFGSKKKKRIKESKDDVSNKHISDHSMNQNILNNCALQNNQQLVKNDSATNIPTNSTAPPTAQHSQSLITSSVSSSIDVKTCLSQSSCSSFSNNSSQEKFSIAPSESVVDKSDESSGDSSIVPHSSSSKMQHLINPFTGQLEPMEIEEDDDSALYSILDDKDDMKKKPGESNLKSKFNDSDKPVDTGSNMNDILSTSAVEKLKLKLKLDSKSTLRDLKIDEKKDGKLEPVQPYRVDVSFVSIPTVKCFSESTVTSNQSSKEPRVPPLHISLKGKSATVVVKDSVESPQTNLNFNSLASKTPRLQSKDVQSCSSLVTPSASKLEKMEPNKNDRIIGDRFDGLINLLNDENKDTFDAKSLLINDFKSASSVDTFLNNEHTSGDKTLLTNCIDVGKNTDILAEALPTEESLTRPIGNSKPIVSSENVKVSSDPVSTADDSLSSKMSDVSVSSVNSSSAVPQEKTVLPSVPQNESNQNILELSDVKEPLSMNKINCFSTQLNVGSISKEVVSPQIKTSVSIHTNSVQSQDHLELNGELSVPNFKNSTLQQKSSVPTFSSVKVNPIQSNCSSVTSISSIRVNPIQTNTVSRVEVASSFPSKFSNHIKFPKELMDKIQPLSTKFDVGKSLLMKPTLNSSTLAEKVIDHLPESTMAEELSKTSKIVPITNSNPYVISQVSKVELDRLKSLSSLTRECEKVDTSDVKKVSSLDIGDNSVPSKESSLDSVEVTKKNSNIDVILPATEDSKKSSLRRDSSSDDRVGQSIFNISSDDNASHDVDVISNQVVQCLSGSASEEEISQETEQFVPDTILSNGFDNEIPDDIIPSPDEAELKASVEFIEGNDSVITFRSAPNTANLISSLSSDKLPTEVLQFDETRVDKCAGSEISLAFDVNDDDISKRSENKVLEKFSSEGGDLKISENDTDVIKIKNDTSEQVVADSCECNENVSSDGKDGATSQSSACNSLPPESEVSFEVVNTVDSAVSNSEVLGETCEQNDAMKSPAKNPIILKLTPRPVETLTSSTHGTNSNPVNTKPPGLVLSPVSGIVSPGNVTLNHNQPGSILMPLNSNAKHLPIKLVTLPTQAGVSGAPPTSRLVELSVEPTNNHVISPIKTVPLSGTSFLNAQHRPMRLVVSKVSPIKANASNAGEAPSANFVPIGNMAAMVVKSVIVTKTSDTKKFISSKVPSSNIISISQSSPKLSVVSENSKSESLVEDEFANCLEENECNRPSVDSSTSEVPPPIQNEVESTGIIEMNADPTPENDSKSADITEVKKTSLLQDNDRILSNSLEPSISSLTSEDSKPFCSNSSNSEPPKESVISKDTIQDSLLSADIHQVPNDVDHSDSIPIDHELSHESVPCETSSKIVDVASTETSEVVPISKKRKLNDESAVPVRSHGTKEEENRKTAKKKTPENVLESVRTLKDSTEPGKLVNSDVVSCDNDFQKSKVENEDIHKKNKEITSDNVTSCENSTQTKASHRNRVPSVSNNDLRPIKTRQPKEEKRSESSSPSPSLRKGLNRDDAKTKRLNDKSKGREKVVNRDDEDVITKRKTRSSSTTSQQEPTEVGTNKRRRR